jgi:hypothetical protein
MNDLREYHLRRARAERALAFSAAHEGASHAHLNLSALHLERLEKLDSERSQSPSWSSRLGCTS